MKLCVVSAYPPEKGNLAEYGYYLTRELAKSKKISRLIVLANKGTNTKTEKRGKIEIIRCWKSNSPFLFFHILQNIKNYNPDLVFFNSHMMSWGKNRIVNFLGALLPTIVKKFFNYKVVVVLHNIVEAVKLNELDIKASRLNLLGSYIATKSLLNVDKVVVTLRNFVPLLRKKYKKDNIVHIPHGTFGKKTKKVKTGGKTILSFGFWRENKNLPLIIEIFKELYKKDKNIKLVIAGTSHPNFQGYLDQLKKEYEKIKNVFFTGYVPEEGLSKLFLSSTVVMLPYTTTTGSSGVIHLAASFGKPVIVSNLPDIKKLMKEENLSLVLVPKNNKEAFKHAIQKIMNDEKLQKRIGEKNLKVAEQLSFSNISKSYIEVFEELLNE